LQKDPIGFKGGDINLFVYVKNKPLIYIDPTGLYPCSYCEEAHLQCLLASKIFFGECLTACLGVTIAFGPAAGALCATGCGVIAIEAALHCSDVRDRCYRDCDNGRQGCIRDGTGGGGNPPPLVGAGHRR